MNAEAISFAENAAGSEAVSNNTTGDAAELKAANTRKQATEENALRRWRIREGIGSGVGAFRDILGHLTTKVSRYHGVAMQKVEAKPGLHE